MYCHLCCSKVDLESTPVWMLAFAKFPSQLSCDKICGQGLIHASHYACQSYYMTLRLLLLRYLIPVFKVIIIACCIVKCTIKGY